jgi:hypothetical protein
VRILLLVLVVIALTVAGAGYVALRGVEVDATSDKLAGRWIGEGAGTVIDLNPDGTFTATGIDACGGHAGAGPAAAAGSGTWSVRRDPANPGVDTLLDMEFRSPTRFRLRWQAGAVTWKFRPIAVTLTSNDTAGRRDGTTIRCALEAADGAQN